MSCIIPVTPNQVLNVYVGCSGTGGNGLSGFNGGGQPGIPQSGIVTDGYGGGSSDVRTSTTLSSRLVIAGGGGGGDLTQPTNQGGPGGGLKGGQCTGKTKRFKLNFLLNIINLYRWMVMWCIRW